MINYIGNTPYVKLQDYKTNHIFAKLEGYNPFGSMKDRSAKYVIKKILDNKVINKNTTIIESTSGNMGVALAAICNHYKLKFIAVVDPSISPINEFLIKSMNAEIVKVETCDENNSYLKSRLSKAKELLEAKENAYWYDQYHNELVRLAYKETLGIEVLNNAPDTDYIFMAVSSLGTSSGVSMAIEEYNSLHKTNIKLITIDIEGSKIYNKNTTSKKHIPGIGSSIVAGHYDYLKPYDHIIIDEKSSVQACYDLLKEDGVFVGGSSGCVYAGMKKFIDENNICNKKFVCIFADRGDRYFDTIYNPIWCSKNIL